MSYDLGQRSLLLHLGMGKTGSSALQVALVRNRSLLASHGVSYPAHESDPIASSGGVTSGNGMRLARFLVPWLRSPGEDAEQHLHDVLSALETETTSRNTLYSSEFLYHFEPVAMGELVRRCADVGVRVQAVVYVRDIAGHAYSEYAQRVKRALCIGSFLDFISIDDVEGYDPALQTTLDGLHQLLGRDGVRVLHYDSLRDRLASHFFECVLGVSTAAQFDSVDQMVNRTLTDAEIDLMRRLNRSLASQDAGKRASDALVGLPPLGALERWITQEEADVLRERFQGQVSWVNATGVEEGQLSLMGNARIGERAGSYALDERHEHLLAWVSRLLS